MPSCFRAVARRAGQRARALRQRRGTRRPARRSPVSAPTTFVGARRRRAARGAARHAGDLADAGRDPRRQLAGGARPHRRHPQGARRRSSRRSTASARSRSSASPIARRSCATTPPTRSSCRTASTGSSRCPAPAPRCSTPSSRLSKGLAEARGGSRRASSSSRRRTSSSAPGITTTCSKRSQGGGAMMHAIVLTTPGRHVARRRGAQPRVACSIAVRKDSGGTRIDVLTSQAFEAKLRSSPQSSRASIASSTRGRRR